MRFKKTLILGVCLVLIIVVAVKSQSPNLNMEPQDDIDTSAEEIASMIESLKSNGWELHDEVEIFKPINLYEKINGRAEYYLSYDLIWAIFGGYWRSMDNRFPIELSIFNMGTPTYAFGVFSGERTVGAAQLKLGREAYYSGGKYYIWKGQYYIQISARDTMHEQQQACLDLAETLANNLNDSDQTIWGLQTLPTKNQVPQSVQYFLIDALGHSFLHNTYTAKYYKDKIEIPVFLSHQDSPATVETIITKFKDHVKKYGKGVELISVDGIKVLVCDMDKYYDVIFQKGSLVAGVIGLKNKDLAVEASIDFWKQIQVE